MYEVSFQPNQFEVVIQPQTVQVTEENQATSAASTSVGQPCIVAQADSAVLQPQILQVTPETQTVMITEIGQQGPAGPPGTGSGGSAIYERAFTQSALSIAGILPVAHGLHAYPSSVTVWDASGETIVPDAIELLTRDLLAVHLESFTPLQGTFTISVTT